MALHTEPVGLQLDGLSKLYGSVKAVDHLNLDIAPGEMVALLGPSGCGKTTSLRMVAGLIEPSAGRILIGGRDITPVPVHKRNIGMLFQSYALFPHLTVAQNTAFGLEMRGVSRADRDRRVMEALQMVQLDSFASRLPRALSGGQQQRVALARALVIEPSVLLLDEPLGALDKALRETMQVELRQIQRRLGITAVIVTHDQDEALTMADRIVIMRGGKLEQVGPPEEIYSRPRTRFVAGFIGASNFLQGTVQHGVGGESEVALPGGAVLHLPQALPTGAVTIALRPEAIHVEADSPAEALAPNSLRATLEQSIYRGAVTHLHLRMADGAPLVAIEQNRDGESLHPELRPGSTVIARWNGAHNHVVTEA